MKPIAFYNLEDLLAFLARRKWWALSISLFAFSLIVFAVFLLPDLYVSETLIVVEPRDVPDDFVRNLVTTNTEERLRAIQMAILSRTNLLRIISEFHDSIQNYDQLDDEERVKILRGHIDIEVHSVHRRSEPDVSYFRVSYENENPKLAHDITDRLASLFIEHDERTRQEQVSGTSQFLDAELEKVSEKLHQASTKLRTLKELYRYELPDQLHANLRTLDRLQEQMKVNSEALDRYVAHRLALERQLSETPADLTREFVSPDAASSGKISPVLIEYRDKMKEYRQLNSRYTANHPDVQRLRSELEQLQTELKPAELELVDVEVHENITTKKIPNPVYEKLMAQLDEVKMELSIREREKSWIQDEMQKYSARVQNTPQREQGISSVLREYEDLSKEYEGLKKKHAEANLAESLEATQKGAHFVIVDPASYPIKPAKPNRLKLIMLGLISALGLGLAFALYVDIADQTLWTQAEVERNFQLPVLAEIPHIVSPSGLALSRKKRVIRSIALTAFTALFIGSLVFIYYMPGPRARAEEYLSLVIQKIERQ